MLIVRFHTAEPSLARVGVLSPDGVRSVPVPGLAELMELPLSGIRTLLGEMDEAVVEDARLLPPVDGATEVWASGVTYLRSRQGRTEESAQSSIYDEVYDAERPELFFKSVAWRVVGPDDTIGMRTDSPQNIPEPELALVVNSHAEVVGYTICDDVSSRTLEGQNPLYLPQAKIFAGACALGPGIRPAWEVPNPRRLDIQVSVVRDGKTVWEDTTSTGQMRRRLDELVAAVFAADTFPQGVVLSTGTGLVPDMGFRLTDGDVVRIGIEGIGTLTNRVTSGTSPFHNLWSRAGSLTGRRL